MLTAEEQGRIQRKVSTLMVAGVKRANARNSVLSRSGKKSAEETYRRVYREFIDMLKEIG